MTVFSFIFYFCGFINALFILNSVGYGRDFLKLKETNPVLYQNKTKTTIITYTLSLIWAVLGLLSTQWLYFMLFLGFIFGMKQINKNFNWIDNPTTFNIIFYKMQRIIIFLIIMFISMNHFHFHLNMTDLIVSLFK